MLALATLIIAVVPFRHVTRLAGVGRKGRPATPAQARDIEQVLAGWARRVPWRAVCFQQGLAAQFMLRRRGLAATLHYGASRDETGRLVAHVWITSGDVGVIGHRTAERHARLAAFSPMA